MHNVNITTAKSHLSSLLREIEDKNEEIIIERLGKPIAKIVKYKPLDSSKRLGALKNKIHIANDFDSWPDDIAKSLGIKE